MDPSVLLRPLAQLQQSICTLSHSDALALSSLRRAPTPPHHQEQEEGQLEWLISLGLARDGQQDRWWQANLDLAAVEKVLTVDNCAITPTEMPKKIKSAWDGGELQIGGLDEALAGEGDGTVQLIICVAEDVSLSVDLFPAADEPIDIPWLKLMTRWANPYTSSEANRLAAAAANREATDAQRKADGWKTEVAHWKNEVERLKKEVGASGSGSGARGGRMGSQSQGGSGSQGGELKGAAGAARRAYASLKKSPKKGQTQFVPKQALNRTNDDPNGGFPTKSDSDSE